LEPSSDGSENRLARSRQQERVERNRALARERRRRTRLEEVESRVAELETRLALIAEQLAVPPEDPEEVLRLGDDYVEIQNELEALIAEWGSLHD
jgi:hypothetical protein